MNRTERRQLVGVISAAIGEASDVRQDYDYVEISGARVLRHLTDLESSGAQVELQGVNGSEGVRIGLEYEGWRVHFDRLSFLADVQIGDFRNDIAILRYDTSTSVYFAGVERQVLDGPCDSKGFFLSTRAYLYLWRFLERSPEIVNYHDSVQQRFVVLSRGRGPFYLGYPHHVPDLSAIGEEGAGEVRRLLRLAKSLAFRKFFRDEIVVFLEYVPDIKSRLPHLYKYLGTVVDASERDFEVYRTQFSFKKLKSKFHAEREAYISRVRDISRSLFNQLVTIPVSFSAAAIALYNVRESVLLGATLLLGFQLIVLGHILQLTLVQGEFSIVRRDLNRDLAKAEAKSIVLYNEIVEEIGVVCARISSLQTATLVLFLIVTLGSYMLVIFFHQAAAPSPMFTTFVIVFSAVAYWTLYLSRPGVVTEERSRKH